MTRDRIQRLSEWGLLAALAVGVAPFVLTSHFFDDEFNNLYDAVQMASGLVIYRDFFEFIAPLSQALAALVYVFAGPSLLAARLLQAAIMVVSGWLAYRLARRLGVGPWAATLPGLVLVFGLYRIWPGYSHHWVVFPWLFGAMWAAMQGLEGGRPRAWALAGVLAGLAFLTMQTDGLMLLVALTATLGAAWLAGLWPKRDLARQAAALVAGAAATLGAAALYFAWHGALGEAWYHVWTWPQAQYRVGANATTYGSDWSALVNGGAGGVSRWVRGFYFGVLFGLMPVAAALTAIWGLRHGLKRWEARDLALLLAALVTAGSLAVAMRGRADFIHVALYCPSAALLLVALAARARMPWRFAVHATLAGFALVGGMYLLREMRGAPEAWLRLESPDARLAATPVVRYLQAHSVPGDRIAAHPNGGYYYFFARPSATRYTIMMPADFQYNSPEENTRHLADVAKARAKFVIIVAFGEEHLGYYQPLVPPGYRRVATLPAPQNGGQATAVIFERP